MPGRGSVRLDVVSLEGILRLCDLWNFFGWKFCYMLIRALVLVVVVARDHALKTLYLY